VTRLQLRKYQALGNDYLVLDLPADLGTVLPLVPRLCDRHLGVGADGLLTFDPAELRVRVFNPDGSEAEKSGNGLRIAAAHAVLEHGAGDAFDLRTQDRANAVRIRRRLGGTVVSELDLGPPRFEPDEWVLLDTPVGTARCRLVDVGNPHCVVIGEEVSEARCRELGPHLERHPRFPHRTNVQLAAPAGDDAARCEIWERGAGYTLASGSSASAVAAVMIRLGLTGRRLRVEMPGGSLEVRQGGDGHLLQEGPASRVHRAEVDLADLG
jgi:diaminopimelate epimerase